jgi:tetratricopeptide (TPR) repeat protein
MTRIVVPASLRGVGSTHRPLPMIRGLCIAGIALAVAISVSLADDVEEAAELFRQAMRRYEASEYLEAARLFERAHAVHPHGDTIFNAAVSYLWAGDCESSRRAFGWYLNDAAAVRADSRVRRAEQALDNDPYASPERLCVLVVELRRVILETEEQGSGERAARLDAGRMFELAQERYTAGEYAEAARLYAVANELVPHRDTVYNLAAAHHWAGNWLDAVRAFESYLAEAPQTRSHADVRAAEAALEAEPYASGNRMCELLSRLKLAICGAEGSGETTGDNEARRAFQQGREQYLRGQWQPAADWFDCANALGPRADTAYNAGLAHWRAGSCTGGHRALGDYLAERTEVAADTEVAAALAALELEVEAPDATECPSLGRLVSAIRAAEGGGG